AALRARRFGLSRLPRPPTPTLFPYTTLFRSAAAARRDDRDDPAAEPPTSEVRAPRVIPFEDAPRDDDARAGATDVSWTDVFWANVFWADAAALRAFDEPRDGDALDDVSAALCTFDHP